MNLSMNYLWLTDFLHRHSRHLQIIRETILLLCLLYFGLMSRIEPGEVGIARNWITGTMRLYTPGWRIDWPWVGVAHIDTKPVFVSASSTGRGYSAKLVQFEPAAWHEFVNTEGWRYYWLDNRLSYNWGFKEECRGMASVFRGYAYSSHRYPFITVLKEL